MKITSGLLKGLKISSAGPDKIQKKIQKKIREKIQEKIQTRPSSEKLRQGIFNILRNYRWPGGQNIVQGDCVDSSTDLHVVDLFAGTGALGIEALSNGAKKVVFVENGRHVISFLKSNMNLALSNLEKQGFTDVTAGLFPLDIGRAYAKLPRSRLVFCDPPYFKGWFGKVIDLESKYSVVIEGGIFIFEADKTEPIDGDVSQKSGLKLFDQKDYGGSRVFFFVKSKYAT